MNKNVGRLKRYKSLKEFQETFLPKLYSKKIEKEKDKFKESGTGLALEMINDIKTKLARF